MTEHILSNKLTYSPLVATLCVGTALVVAHYPMISGVCFFLIALGVMLPLRWLTWLVIAAAPLQFTVIGLSGISYEISYFDVILLLLVICFAWNVAHGKVPLTRQWLVYALVLFCGVGLLSLVPVGFPVEGIHYLLRFVAVLIVFLSVIHFARECDFAWTLSAVFVGLWMVVIVSVINVVYGMETLGAAVRTLSQDPLAIARIGSIYNQPNVTGHALAVFLPMIFGFAFLPAQKGVTRFFMLATAILLGGLLILTGSRGAMISAGVGLVILTFYARRSSLLLMMAALCGFSLLNLPYVEQFFLDVRVPSLEGRIDLIHYGVEITREHPILGVGIRQFSSHLYDVRPFLMGRSSHNLYLEVLVEMGILGLAAFSLFVVCVWRRLGGASDQKGGLSGTVRGIGLSSFAALFCSKLFTGGLLLVTWWIALAVIIGFADRLSLFQRSKNHLWVRNEGFDPRR